jgi:hypothetical protein
MSADLECPAAHLVVASWPNSRVLTWLLSNELTQFLHTFASQGVSGAVLLEYAEEPAKIDNLFAPGHTAEPVSPTPTQISALKYALKNLADETNLPKAANTLTSDRASHSDPVSTEGRTEIPKTLDDWRKVIRTSSVAHDVLCRRFRFRGSVLTLLVVTLNTIVTSAILR